MTVSQPKELVLVDGSSYLYRAFHALPPLVTSRGQPTGAVKGVINMIRALMKACDHENIAIVFDAKGKTFRNEIFEGYKAHRPPMPDDLKSQIEPIHQIIRAMGLPLLVVEGVEADDVIGTLSQQASENGIKTLISTGDKDLAQLVNDHVTLINTMTNEMLDTDGVVKKFGVKPNRIIDYLALMGDKSDNIPGVPGVGPKTALKWLQEYESMEGIIENANKISGKVGERLRENLELLRLSYELATIKLDVDLDTDIQNLTKKEDEKQVLHEIFSKMEFKTWIKELEQEGTYGTSSTGIEIDSGNSDLKEVAIPTPKGVEYSPILSKDDLDEVTDKLRELKKFSISVEFKDTHFMDAAILGIAISIEPGKAFYIPLGHDYPGCPEQLPIKHTLKSLKPIIENPSIIKVGYDLKQIRHLFQNYDILLQPIKSDLLLTSYVLNSVAVKHSLADIASYYLKIHTIELESLTGKGRNKLSPDEIVIDDYTNFAAEKADFVFRLTGHLEQKLAARGHLAGLYKYYELPLVEVLLSLERNGIRIDKKVLEKQGEELTKKLTELEKTVCDVAGEEFNLSSPKQLQSILYEKLELPILKKTPTGQPSTAEPVLHELAKDYELPRLVLEHRSLNKLKSTYTDKLPLEVNENTGRIHSSFQQAVTATGRLSSTDPNLQNIPIRTAEGRRVRRAFVTDPGYKLIAADYSQVELRIMAHLSRDEGLLTAFSSGEDIHRATAADVFNIPVEQVNPEQRRSAKAINFGLIYGMSAFGLAKQLDVNLSDARDYVDRYFKKYPGVRSYMDETQALADEKGYVETIFGRRLYLPDIHAGNAIIRKAAQRTAINAPMQGSAADIIKRAMIDISHWLALDELDARMLLQVHDELVFEVLEEDLDLIVEGVKFRMITAASLDVPLVVDVGVGDNWDQAH
mgnify:FL=1